MKCPYCNGLGEVLDVNGEAMPCEACACTGEETPEEAMPWDVQCDAADEFAASDEFVTFIENIMNAEEAMSA